MTKKPPITYARLREVLHYNPETGIFTWLQPISKRVSVGSPAGSVSKRHRYIMITIDGVRRGAHQWAVFYVTGVWPQKTVDHRDRSRSNNKWDNLRNASHQEQNRNVGLQSNNTSGFKGVSWHKAAQKWHARIWINYQCINLGLFDQAEDAGAAYQIAAKEHFGEFA